MIAWICWMALVFLPQHEFYVSVTELRYEEEFGTFSLKVKVFSDDLEAALQQAGGIDVSTYFPQKIRLEADGRHLALRFMRQEILEDATWCTFESERACEWQQVRIEARQLMELFDAQTNIIRLRVGEKRSLFNLDKQVPYEVYLR